MSANPQPVPDAGETQPSTPPTLNVINPPEEPKKRKRREPGQLDAQQTQDIKQVVLRCLAAQKTDYAGTLATYGISAEFVTALLARARAISNTDNDALDHTSDSQVATRAGQDATRTLVTSLRGLQSTGRQLHQETNPEKLKDYLIGEDITSNRATLERSAQTIIAKADAERGPGVNTAVITRVEGELAAIGQANQTQQDEKLTAQQMRAATAREVAAIKAECRKILFAADRAWPYTNSANAAVRKKFQLPDNRVYAPRAS